MTITWVTPDQAKPAVSGYTIETKVGENDWVVESENTESTDTSYTIEDAFNSDKITQVRVAAINTAGEGPFDTVKATLVSPRPDAPRDLKAQIYGSRAKALLTWRVPAYLGSGNDPITGYKIEGRSSTTETPTGSWVTVSADTGNTDTTYTQTGTFLETNHYWYRVSAINSQGTGAAITVKADPPGPPAPVTGVAADINDGGTESKVSWDVPTLSDADLEISGYKIEISE